MTDRAVPAILEWRVHREADAEFVVVTCIDSRTQSTYEFTFPLHAAASLQAAIDEFIAGNPDLFADIDTRRIG